MHRLMTDRLKLRTVINAGVRGKERDECVDVAIVDVHAIVAMESLDVSAKRVVSPMQFAPLYRAQYANERLVGDRHVWRVCRPWGVIGG